MEEGGAVSISVVAADEVTSGTKDRDDEGFKVTEISRLVEDSIPGNELSAGELVAAEIGTRYVER